MTNYTAAVGLSYLSVYESISDDAFDEWIGKQVPITVNGDVRGQVEITAISVNNEDRVVHISWETDEDVDMSFVRSLVQTVVSAK